MTRIVVSVHLQCDPALVFSANASFRIVEQVESEVTRRHCSVKKLSLDGVDVLFTGRGGLDRAEFRKDGNLIGVAHLRGNLYQLELGVGSKGQVNISVAETSKLCHRRLGHAVLMKYGMITGFVEKLGGFGFYDMCVTAKQCREPFDGVRERATRLLERIHRDVCGLIDPPAWDGS